MTQPDNNACPRCTGSIPTNEKPGAYPGALSRVSDIEICSRCGSDEAMRDLMGLPPIPPYDWPVLYRIGDLL